MLQEFNVVRCFSCATFQVDMKKMSSNWTCKLCGEKQSLKKVYSTSESAKECREIVKQLNEKRREMEEEVENIPNVMEEEFEYAPNEQEYNASQISQALTQITSESNIQRGPHGKSRWSKYLVKSNEK